MKKLLIFTISLLLSATVYAQRGESKTKYFYAIGWEYLPRPNQSASKIQPVVSNVFSTRCKEEYLPIKKGITNELNDYYTAYYSKSRGFNGLHRMIAFGDFETYDEAEKERRKTIADYNRDWNPLLVQGFTAGCD